MNDFEWDIHKVPNLFDLYSVSTSISNLFYVEILFLHHKVLVEYESIAFMLEYIRKLFSYCSKYSQEIWEKNLVRQWSNLLATNLLEPITTHIVSQRTEAEASNIERGRRKRWNRLKKKRNDLPFKETHFLRVIKQERATGNANCPRIARRFSQASRAPASGRTLSHERTSGLALHS